MFVLPFCSSVTAEVTFSFWWLRKLVLSLRLQSMHGPYIFSRSLVWNLWPCHVLRPFGYLFSPPCLDVGKHCVWGLKKGYHYVVRKVSSIKHLEKKTVTQSTLLRHCKTQKSSFKKTNDTDHYAYDIQRLAVGKQAVKRDHRIAWGGCVDARYGAGRKEINNAFNIMQQECDFPLSNKHSEWCISKIWHSATVLFLCPHNEDVVELYSVKWRHGLSINELALFLFYCLSISPDNKFDSGLDS